MKGRGYPSINRNENIIFKARNERNMSAMDLANIIGCSVSYIHKIERGVVDLKSEFIKKVEIALGLKILEGKNFSDRNIAERVVEFIRNPLPSLDMQKNLDDESMELNPDNFKFDSVSDEDGLQILIEKIFKEEIKKDNSKIVFLWTGKNYLSYSNFYNSIYERYIRSIKCKNKSILHLIRDGSNEEEKLNTIEFCIEKILNIRNNETYSIKVVNNMGVQAYTNDIYWAREVSGSLICWTGSSFGEPSIGVWTPRRQDLIKKYLMLVESNSEERVAYFPQAQREKFYRKYLTTESRSGDWAMIQRLPASSTRLMADYMPDTPWAKRAMLVEEACGNKISIENLIEIRRTSTELFLDRLSSGNFRQILSKEAIEKWIQSGVREDIDNSIDFPVESAIERKLRLKNIVDLMTNSKHRFQIAISEDRRMENLGFSDKYHNNVSWVVQGDQASTFEGVDRASDNKYMQMHMIVRSTEFNSKMRHIFDSAWKSLPSDQTNQEIIKAYLIDKMRDIK